MNRDTIKNKYYRWMSNLVIDENHKEYTKLLMFLHNTEYKYSIPMDENRYEDGLYLRHRFVYVNKYDDNFDDICEALESPCSVLEMLIALTLRWYESFSYIDDTIPEFFWDMIDTLYLFHMNDQYFDKRVCIYRINKFLNREYESDGKYGLFHIKHSPEDLRDVELWTQLCWYIDERG